MSPDPASVQQHPTPPDRLIMQVVYPRHDPTALFACWTEPDRLAQWWPPVAEVESHLGGAYHLAWPQMNWHLRGHYTAWEPDVRLTFTWAWDHEPATAPTMVEITFAPDPAGGTRLTLRHGPYAATSAGATERQGHLEGWTHFLTRLQAVQ